MDDAPIGKDAAPLHLRLQPGGDWVVLTSPDVVVGRHSTADLRLPMPDVSRRHCRFVCGPDGWEVVDLNSANGVYVNDIRVQRSLIGPGDHLRIGGLEIEVSAPRPETVVLPVVTAALSAEPMQRKAS